MNGKIYMLTNNITRKKYIGQTTIDVATRIRNGYAQTTLIGAALQAHGGQNFTYDILKTGITTQENLNYWENYYIDFYGTLSPNGYNERRA